MGAEVDTMTWRVTLHSTPSPAYVFYRGSLEVEAVDREEAVFMAKRQLKRTTFRDRGFDDWVVEKVEPLELI